MSELERQLSEAADAVSAAEQRAGTAEAAADELGQRLRDTEDRAQDWEQQAVALRAQVGTEQLHRGLFKYGQAQRCCIDAWF